MLNGIWPPQRSMGKILPGTCAHHWKRKPCLGEVITWVDYGQCREGRVQCTERPLELVDRSGGEATGVATLPTVQTCSFGTALYEITPEDKLIPTQSRRFFLRMVVRGRRVIYGVSPSAIWNLHDVPRTFLEDMSQVPPPPSLVQRLYYHACEWVWSSVPKGSSPSLPFHAS